MNDICITELGYKGKCKQCDKQGFIFEIPMYRLIFAYGAEVDICKECLSMLYYQTERHIKSF